MVLLEENRLQAFDAIIVRSLRTIRMRLLLFRNRLTDGPRTSGRMLGRQTMTCME